MNQKQINKIILYIKDKYGAYITINPITKEIILALPEEIDLNFIHHGIYFNTNIFLFFNETEMFFKDLTTLNTINDYYTLKNISNLVPLKNLQFKKVKIYIDKLFELYIKEYNEIIKNNQKNRKEYYLKILNEL